MFLLMVLGIRTVLASDVTS